MAKKGLLIILSGPSGVGKGTVRKIFMRDSSLNLHFSVSMTTRVMRYTEVEGKDYYFVSKEEFDEQLKKGNLLEHAEFVGNKYGTPKDKVEEHRNNGENVLLEIEVNGATQVMNKLKDDPGLVTIFLMPPSLEELESRIRHRSTEPDDIIMQRLNKARGEMNIASNYQYVVVNDDVKKAAKEIKKIIKERLKKAAKNG